MSASSSKPSLREVERDAALVEDTHHDRFAVHRRHGRYAQVDFLALHAQADAPVLRQAALGDVEVGHDLDARDHRGRQAPRRRFDFVQHAVDAVADDQPILERLDVNVGRAHFERIGDEQRHEADHRRFGREVLQLLHVRVERKLVGARLDVAEQLALRGLARAVEALERRLEIGGNGHHRAHGTAGHELECADRVARPSDRPSQDRVRPRPRARAARAPRAGTAPRRALRESGIRDSRSRRRAAARVARRAPRRRRAARKGRA